MESKEISFEIVSHIGVVSEGGKSWKKELNLVSWNEREPKIDLREWSPDHLHMGKGITLTREEGRRVVELISAHLKGL